MAVTFVVSRGTGAGAEHGVVGTGVTPAGGRGACFFPLEV